MFRTDPFPGQIRLSAHSLGNVPAGEALRTTALPRRVSVYAAMQGAVPAHAYDATMPTREIPFPLDSSTPNRFAKYYDDSATEYFRQSHKGADLYVAFVNPVDAATTVPFQLNQDLKPQGAAGTSGYTYLGNNNFLAPFPSSGDDGLRTFPAHTYELFSFCIEGRCYSIGAQAQTGGLFSREREVLLDPAPFNFGAATEGHSAQFRFTNMKVSAFWDKLLEVFGIVNQ